MRCVWLGTLLGASGCFGGGTEIEQEFTNLTALDVSLGNGEIYISSSLDAVTRVIYEGGGFGRPAQPDVLESDSGLLTIDGKGGLGGGDITIELAGGVPIASELQRGETTIELSFPSNIDACVGAGELSIGLPAGSYNIDISAGAGEVDIGLVNDPTAETSVRACAGAGEIDLYVFASGQTTAR